MPQLIKVVQYGLGPIGNETARAVIEKSKNHNLELVGAIDIDRGKVGKDVGQVIGLDRPTGIIVREDAEKVLQETQPDVVLHTTSSFLSKISSQIVLCIKVGANVVSSAKELFFPLEAHSKIAAEIDLLAKKNGVAVLGTGVNPGFVMDTLVLVTTSICKSVKKIKVERVVDTSKRRLQLQRKTGAGLSTLEFQEKQKTGTFGHIGLRESLFFIAKGLNWDLKKVSETLQPLIAEREFQTSQLKIEAGRVMGIHHIVRGYLNGDAAIELDLKMGVGAQNPHDAICIEGDPPVDLFIRNGVFDDTATAAALVNAIPLVLGTTPGLKTMMDIPVPRAFMTQ